MTSCTISSRGSDAGGCGCAGVGCSESRACYNNGSSSLGGCSYLLGTVDEARIVIRRQRDTRALTDGGNPVTIPSTKWEAGSEALGAARQTALKSIRRNEDAIAADDGPIYGRWVVSIRASGLIVIS